MSKHTPGPWALHCDGTSKTLTGADHYDQPYVAVVGSGGEVVCDNAHYYAQQVKHEDMRLIAAAPDLLEALESIVSRLEHSFEYTGIDVSDAKSAIARAKGESQ